MGRVFLCTTAATALVMLSSAPRARANVVVTATQVGSDVVFTGGGTLDLTGMTFKQSGTDPGGAINPTEATILMGPLSATDDVYAGLTGPANFGSGLGIFASSESGAFFGISNLNGVVGVPAGYTSGSIVSATDTYTGQTFASLGMTPGTYVWTLPSTDTFTLQIGPTVTTAVPTPMAASAGLTLLAGLGLWKLRRRSAITEA
jgi:hypothetical protein